MHEACEIIAKLVDDKKIDGKDAVYYCMQY